MAEAKGGMVTAVFKIDNVDMTYKPSHVQVTPPEVSVYPGPGTGKGIVQPMIPPILEVRWGVDAAIRSAIAELKTKRGRRLIHALSWTNEGETGTKHCNAMIPEIGYGQGPSQSIADVFTLKCEVVNPMPALMITELFMPGVLTTGDGKIKWLTPAGGRILKVRGAIGTLGTGAGQTRVQVSNGATDYLTTPGDFVVASGTNLMENQVLTSSATFNRGDTIELDIDVIPGGSDSADVSVLLYCLLFRV